MADAPEQAAVPQSVPSEAPALSVTQGQAGAVAPPRADAPPITSAPEPIVSEAPIATSAPAVSVVPEASVAPHTDTGTLLEEAGKPKEPDASAPPDSSVAPEASAAPQVTLAPYTIPDGLNLLPEPVAAFNAIITDAALSPQERGQKLVDMHIAELKRYAEFTRIEQHKTFAEFRNGERQKIIDDPILGGAGLQTTLNAVADMRDQFVSAYERGSAQYKAEMEEFNQMLRITGAGDMRPMIRLMHNVARRFAEPAPVSADRPPADIGLRPNKASGRRATLYDNPTSHRNRN